MKNLLRILFAVLLTTSISYAQRGKPGERIHAAKMAFITDRLQLSAEQSGHFTPIYNEYENELRSIRHSFSKKYKGKNQRKADDAAARQYIDDDLDYQQQILDLKRRYNDRFLKVISPQQLADLYKAEREFKQILMKRLDRRSSGSGRFRR